MATHQSAVKEHRRAQRRRAQNRQRRSSLRTAVKRLRAAIAAGNVDQARSLLPMTLSLLDRSAKTRAVHPNAADRTKSRLTRALNRLA